MDEGAEAHDPASLLPADFVVPPSYVVQALSDRYIRASVLTAALESLWPGKWDVVTKLSYHVVILPRVLTKAEIKALQKKSMKAATI